MTNQEIDHHGTDEVICPYCGHNNGGYSGDGPPSGILECYNPECEKKFECEPSYSVSYYTSKVPCLNGEPHRWNTPYFFSPEDEKGHRFCKDCRKDEWVPR